MTYEIKPSLKFIEEVKSTLATNPKIKSMLRKATDIIKENPHYKAEYIKEMGCWRKHIAAEKYRIFYDIDDTKKIVTLLHLRLKNKATYRG